MKRFQFLQFAATAIACVGLVLPSGVRAAEAVPAPVLASAAEAPTILDVTLGEGGTLNGVVLNPEGNPMAQAVVNVRTTAAEVASTTTDTQGRFAIRGLHGGVYEVSSGGSSGVLRLWTATASPPSANKEVLIVAGGEVNRGQCGVQCPGQCAGQCATGRCTTGQGQGQKRCYAGPRVIGDPTNGQILLASLLILGAAGGMVAVITGNQAQPSGS